MRTPNRRIHNTYTDSRPSGVGSSGKARKSRKKCESHVKALKKRKKAQKEKKKTKEIKQSKRRGKEGERKDGVTEQRKKPKIKQKAPERSQIEEKNQKTAAAKAERNRLHPGTVVTCSRQRPAASSTFRTLSGQRPATSGPGDFPLLPENFPAFPLSNVRMAFFNGYLLFMAETTYKYF